MRTITPSELMQKLKDKAVTLIDVREISEYEDTNIAEAHLIPLEEICVAKLPTTTKPIIIHCRSGVRSANACAQLLNEDASLELYSLEGGIVAWQDEGYPVRH